MITQSKSGFGGNMWTPLRVIHVLIRQDKRKTPIKLEQKEEDIDCIINSNYPQIISCYIT